MYIGNNNILIATLFGWFCINNDTITDPKKLRLKNLLLKLIIMILLE